MSAATEKAPKADRVWRAGHKQMEIIRWLRAEEGRFIRRYRDDNGIVKNWRGRAGGFVQRFSNAFVGAMIERGVLVRVADDTPAELVGVNGKYVLAPEYAAYELPPVQKARKPAPAPDIAPPDPAQSFAEVVDAKIADALAA